MFSWGGWNIIGYQGYIGLFIRLFAVKNMAEHRWKYVSNIRLLSIVFWLQINHL